MPEQPKENKNKVIRKLPSGRPNKDVTRAYQFDICLWIAEGKTTRQILDLVEDKYYLKMSSQNINVSYRWGKKWKKVIQYLRSRYLKNLSRIPIANKAHRLRLLHQAAEECLKWRTKSVNQYGIVQEMKVGVLPSLISEARKEIEGERPLIDASQHTHFTKIDIKDLEGKSKEELIDIVFRRGNGVLTRK